eukprot:g27603.t1
MYCHRLEETWLPCTLWPMVRFVAQSSNAATQGGRCCRWTRCKSPSARGRASQGRWRGWTVANAMRCHSCVGP